MSRIVLIFLFLIIVFTGCGPSAESNGKIKITCTTGIIADALKNMYGEAADITPLMGPGVDPHLYKPSQRDLQLLQQADLIVYNGLHLEGKMTDIFKKLKRNKKVYSVSSSIPVNRLRLVDAKAGVFDPHIWFDVDLWKTGLQGMHKEISADFAVLSNQASFVSAYLNLLDSLNKSVLLKVASIEPSSRILITSHDAFHYFGKAYGVEVKGLQGISTVAEYGLKDVTDLVNYIISHHVSTVFIETSVSSRSIDAVIKGCEAKGAPVKIGGKLYSDALGEEGTSEGTYEGMVLYNVNLMVNGWKVTKTQP